jgi:hypothetical protein
MRFVGRSRGVGSTAGTPISLGFYSCFTFGVLSFPESFPKNSSPLHRLHGLYDLNLAVEAVGAFDQPAEKNPAFEAGARALFGVAMAVGCSVEGIAVRRYPYLVHSDHPSCGPGSGVLLHLRGHSFIRQRKSGRAQTSPVRPKS